MSTVKQYSLSFTGFLASFLGAVLFSTKAIIVKEAFRDIHADALSLLAVRMLFSLPFYLGMAVFTRSRQPGLRFTRQQWMGVVVLGLFGYYLSSLLDFIGLQFVSAGLERLILFLYPSFAVIINATVFQQKINRVQLLALVITYAGIAIAYAGQLQVETGTPAFYTGSALIFLCAITFASYIAGSGRLIPQVGSARFTVWSMLAATAGVLLHYLLKGNYQLLYNGAGYWKYGIGLAIIATVIPSFLVSYGMKKIGANNGAIISGIGPVSTIIQAHWLLGEKIFAAQIAGTLLVIAGVLLIGWKSKTTPA